MEDKAEKKKQREAELLDREARKKRLEKEEQERNLQDAKEQEKEKIQLEEEQRIREEKERKEQEEYDKLKEAFIVDEEGFDEDPEEDQENKLEKFIQYIKDTKVVVLEDLAAHFQMKTDDTIDRVSTLIKEEKLTGMYFKQENLLCSNFSFSLIHSVWSYKHQRECLNYNSAYFFLSMVLKWCLFSSLFSASHVIIFSRISYLIKKNAPSF